MWGHKDYINANAYDDGPSTWWRNFERKEDYIIVVKNRSGQTIACFDSVTEKPVQIPESHEQAGYTISRLPQ